MDTQSGSELERVVFSRAGLCVQVICDHFCYLLCGWSGVPVLSSKISQAVDQGLASTTCESIHISCLYHFAAVGQTV